MTGTDKICELLNDYFQKCKSEGKEYVILRASDIEDMFDIARTSYGNPNKNRYPAICSAMKRLMNDKDDIVFATLKNFPLLLLPQFHNIYNLPQHQRVHKSLQHFLAYTLFYHFQY